MNFDLNVDDLIADLGIHFEIEPLNTGHTGWSPDDESNIETTREARKIILRWLVNKGFIEPEDIRNDL